MNDTGEPTPRHERAPAGGVGDARPIGVALLGYGAIAAMHVPAIRAAGGRIEVVAGPRAAELERFAGEHGITATTTVASEAIGHPGVEAVVIASPTLVHVPQSAEALEAGRHALVEIPLATSLADGERLVALARERSRVLAVCHTLRYWRPVERLHETLAARGLRPTHVVARALSLRHADVGWTGRQRSWVDDLLWHHGGHVVDEVLALLGSPVVDVGSASGPAWPTSGKAMDHAISLRTADGRVATIALSYHARIGASEYLVIGEDETVLLSGGEVRWSDGGVSVEQDVAAVQQAAVAAQDADFLAAVRRGGPDEDGRATRADAASVLPTLRVLQAVADRA
jgi:2-hydroxy-4-carboxymuconate semialdehyde hemiacetal dehydrogenase